MLAAHRVDQLGVDADAPIDAPGAALQKIAHAQLLADRAHVQRLALVGKDRVAGDDEQPRGPGQVGDQVLGEAVGEGILLGIAAEIDEGQHGDRRLGRQRQGLSPGAAEPLDGPGEAVADARNRGDPVAAVGGRAEQLAQERDLDGEVAFLDGGVRPCRVHQLGLAEDLARPADQRGEQALAAVADGDGDVVPKQRSGSRVEHERTEGEARSLHAAIYSPFASFWNS